MTRKSGFGSGRIGRLVVRWWAGYVDAAADTRSFPTPIRFAG